MVIFAGFRPGAGASSRPERPGFRVPFPPPGSVPPNPNIADANPGTFYSAMSNIDFEIGKGNAGAVAHPLPWRAARLSQPHGFPYRLGPGRPHQVGQ